LIIRDNFDLFRRQNPRVFYATPFRNRVEAPVS
jgi:hypothetical protein